MFVNVYFCPVESSCDCFDHHVHVLEEALKDYIDDSPFHFVHLEVYKGGCHEETPQKTCNQGVRKSRRNKAVKNANKSS